MFQTQCTCNIWLELTTKQNRSTSWLKNHGLKVQFCTSQSNISARPKLQSTLMYCLQCKSNAAERQVLNTHALQQTKGRLLLVKKPSAIY